MKTVPEMLEQSAAVYRERNALYKDNYKQFGRLMTLLCPEHDADYWNQRALLVMIVSKLTRYSQVAGGHDDSLMDMAVYATMLREIDNEREEAPF
jgi:hypothetical protein